MANLSHLIALYIIALSFNVIKIAEAGLVQSGHTVDYHKEREEDGAISPHDRNHYSDSGEHRSDFDHEAILGTYDPYKTLNQIN